MADDSFLMAYFTSELEADGEQIRLAVALGDDPSRWLALNGGEPVLISEVGDRGVRDPFLLRTGDGRVVLLATDLRMYPHQDWASAERQGSRAIIIWETTDLVEWSAPRRVELAPRNAGNTWAPKAFWSQRRSCWLVIWASTLFDPDDPSRRQPAHQRLLCAPTSDFRTFGAAEPYLDPGRDVIDATFLEDEGWWYRFTATVSRPGQDPLENHIRVERARDIEDPSFELVSAHLGSDHLVRGEGPAAFTNQDGSRHYLLIDEFGLSGYHLFETDDLASTRWTHRDDARLPQGARHGSVLPIDGPARTRLLERFPAP